MSETQLDLIENEKRPARRVLAAIMGEAWTITDAGYDKLIEIASRDNVITPEVLEKIEARREAVAAKKAARMDNTDAVMKRDGVAIIDVSGPIFRYADMFSYISGATTIEQLATDINAALNDPSVKSIILTFDSPGGQVSGVNELANMIANREQTKPVVAYVGTMAASGGYWIASACDEIVIDATADVGSIGCVVSARVSSSSNVIEKVSKQSPKKRLSPSSEAGQAEMQATADAIAQVFIDFVSAHRPEGADLLQGGMAMGAKAVEAKLADRVGSFEETLARMTDGSTSRVSSHSAVANKKENGMSTNPNRETQLEADLASTKEALVKATEELKKVAEREKKNRESSARAEAATVIAKLSSAKDLRFGKEALEVFSTAYTDAKIASVADSEEVAALGTKMVAHLDKLAAAQAPVAPAGEAKPAKVQQKADDELTAEDFTSSSAEADAKLAKAIDRYIAENNLKGPDAYSQALRALAKKAGAKVPSAAVGLVVSDPGDEEGED